MEEEGRVAAVVHDEGLEAGPDDLRSPDLRRGKARPEVRREPVGRVRQVFRRVRFESRSNNLH